MPNYKQMCLSKTCNEEQFAMTKILFENFSLKEKTGRISPFELMRVQALLQQDSALVLAADNNIRYTKFVLTQMLNSSDSSGIDYDFLVLNEKQLVDGLRVFNDWQVDTMQEIRVAQLNKEIAEIEYKIYKSQLLPRLTINSALGSGYSGNNTELVGTSFVAKPYGCADSREFISNCGGHTICAHIQCLSRKKSTQDVRNTHSTSSIEH